MSFKVHLLQSVVKQNWIPCPSGKLWVGLPWTPPSGGSCIRPRTQNQLNCHLVSSVLLFVKLKQREWTDPILASCLCGFVLGHHSAALSWQEGTGKILEWDQSPVASSSHCGCISPRCRISLGLSPTLPATPLPLIAAIDYLLRYKKCSKFRPVDESSSAGCESGQDDL